jgi:hypothetical protein
MITQGVRIVKKNRAMSMTITMYMKREHLLMVGRVMRVKGIVYKESTLIINLEVVR